MTLDILVVLSIAGLVVALIWSLVGEDIKVLYLRWRAARFVRRTLPSLMDLMEEEGLLMPEWQDKDKDKDNDNDNN